ncbi:GNAT family N-acetyltransferase [Geitlerinema splendidum]|nr:GNAT family N-acetyltransferase [Geitlerinema splendidum]
MSQLQITTVSYITEQAAINSIRVKVFQEEQGVDPELEFDGEDENAEHLLAYLDRCPVGTVRIRFLTPQTAKIERLAVLDSARGKGIGKQLMEKAIAVAAQKQAKEVIVNAQAYIQALYLQLGFVAEGELFEEAGIDHVKMRKVLT